ncbi:MAG: hypothetical protein ACK5LC_06915 [Coprobacillaceae bacterium]
MEELFYVGRATKTKLNAMYIDTIGKLATCKRVYLELKLGKFGGMIWDFANGIDNSFIPEQNYQHEIKSIGNSITAIHDINNFEEAKSVFYVLSESVASRLRDSNFKGRTISISLRDKNLKHFGTRQMKLSEATNTTDEIMYCVKKLLKNNYDFKVPLRSIGVSVSSLEKPKEHLQLSLFDNTKEVRQENLEQAIDNIRNKYGFDKIKRCSMLQHGDLTNFNPKDDHTIHPVSYFN